MQPIILATSSTSQIADLPVIYSVVGGFLVLLVGIGLVFRRFSANSSDYFRAGAQATWWLVGSSIFMGQFSAWTFTGAAGAAFESGWSLVVQFGANVMGFALQGLFTAAWFRQAREITTADLVRLRFGPGLERFIAGTGVFIGPLFGGIQLYSLAIFVSALLHLEVQVVVAVLGVVVLVYVVISGAWAVLAADFVQCLLVLPMTVVMAVLSLRELGGFAGLLAAIDLQGLGGAFSPIKHGEATNLLPAAARQFTFGFFAAWYLNQFLTFTSLNYMAGRYLSAKDGREASRAAWFAAGLMFVGMFLWFVPPIAARLTIADQVLGMALRNPAEGAYAAMAIHLLPPALVGVVLVALCAATMSSLDSGLTSQAAQITENIYPALCRLFGWKEVTGRARLHLGRAANLTCALLVLGIALLMSRFGAGGVFQIMLDVIALVMAPVGVPLCLALFLRSATARAALSSMVVGWITSSAVRFGPGLFGYDAPQYHVQIFALVAAASLAFLGATFLLRDRNPDQAARSREFFARRDRQVDFAREVGKGSDGRQFTVVGCFGLAVGAGIFLLLIPDSSASHRAVIAIVASFTFAVGLVLVLVGRRLNRTRSLSP